MPYRLPKGRPSPAPIPMCCSSAAYAPFRCLASNCVSTIVARAMRKAGVACPSRGAAHVLRHSVATAMLRQGASLQEIATVLRHRSIETTEIYAKVDLTAPPADRPGLAGGADHANPRCGRRTSPCAVRADSLSTSEGNLLRSFAAFSEARGKHHVCSEAAIEWSGLATIRPSARPSSRPRDSFRPVRPRRRSIATRCRRRSLWQREAIPAYPLHLFPGRTLLRLVQAAAQSSHPFRRQTYLTLFALLSCTGLRVSEAIWLRLDDIMPGWFAHQALQIPEKPPRTPASRPRGADSNGTSNIASLMPPSIITYSCRCEESRCLLMMSKAMFKFAADRIGLQRGEASSHTPLVAPHLRGEGPGGLALMAATASRSIWWRSRPISATAGSPIPTGTWRLRRS